MNYSIREMPVNHPYSEMSYGNHGEGGKGIFFGDSLIAYAWFDLRQRKDQKVIMHLEMIEVIDKGEGHGTRVISFLFKQYGIDVIEGSILLESSMRPYLFWSSLGADSDVDDEEEYLDMYEQGFDITFSLERNKVVKETILGETA